MSDWIQGRVISRIAWNSIHFSLRIECERANFIAGQFLRVGLDIDGVRVTRPYSCVNPPHQAGVEIFFNTVPEGNLSHRLAQLQPGDEVWLSKHMHGFLTLPDVPVQARDLWMVATGTGVGPFLSILQTKEPWQRFERVVLAYGVRDPQHYCYPQLLEEVLAKQPQRLRIVPCITAHAPATGFHGRVTEALSSGALEEIAERQIDPALSHFMLCGNQEMIREFSDLLKARGLRRHLRREPGQISSEKYH